MGEGRRSSEIKEGKCALSRTRPSCQRLVANQVRGWLIVLAYDLGDFPRRLGVAKAIGNWSLRSVEVKPSGSGAGGGSRSTVGVPIGGGGRAVSALPEIAGAHR